MSNNKLLLSKTSLEFQPTRSNIIWRWWTTKSYNKFCYCRNRRRALWRKHSILLEKWIKQYKLGRIRQVAILNSPVVTSWRTESSNISLVVLDKLLYYSRNLVFFIFQNFLKTNRPTNLLKLEISLSFDKKYFARYHFRFVIFSLF